MLDIKKDIADLRKTMQSNDELSARIYQLKEDMKFKNKGTERILGEKLPLICKFLKSFFVP